MGGGGDASLFYDFESLISFSDQYMKEKITKRFAIRK